MVSLAVYHQLELALEHISHLFAVVLYVTFATSTRLHDVDGGV